MLSSVTLNDSSGTPVTIHAVSPTAKRALISVKGLLGVGALRQTKRVRPNAHGSINETKYEEGRTVTLEGEVASGVSVEEAMSEFRAMMIPMIQTLDVGPALLKWEEGVGSGLKLQMLVKLDSDIEPILSGVAPRLVYQASLFAEDPRAYTQTQMTVKGAAISGSAIEGTFSNVEAYAKVVCVDPTGTDKHVYWIDRTTKAIGRAAIGGGTVEKEWVKTTEAPLALARDATYVYWGTAGGYVGRVLLAGTSVENTFFKAGGGNANFVEALAVNASNIYYWSRLNAGVIGRATLAGASPTQWIATPFIAAIPPPTLALDATYVYIGYSQKSGAGIARVKLTAEELKNEWIASGVTSGIAVNATNIFWMGAGSIGRAKIAGTEVNNSFLPGVGTTSGLAIDASHLYWGSNTNYLARSKEIANGGPQGSPCKVEQAGNRPAPLIFKINGLCLNPSVIRKSDGARITLLGEITAGNFAEIDTQARTVKLNGEANLLSYLDPQNTNWEAFQAPASPGSETYELVATSATTATLEVLFRSAYA